MLQGYRGLQAGPSNGNGDGDGCVNGTGSGNGSSVASAQVACSPATLNQHEEQAAQLQHAQRCLAEMEQMLVTAAVSLGCLSSLKCTTTPSHPTGLLLPTFGLLLSVPLYALDVQGPNCILPAHHRSALAAVVCMQNALDASQQHLRETHARLSAAQVSECCC